MSFGGIYLANFPSKLNIKGLDNPNWLQFGPNRKTKTKQRPKKTQSKLRNLLPPNRSNTKHTTPTKKQTRSHKKQTRQHSQVAPCTPSSYEGNSPEVSTQLVGHARPREGVRVKAGAAGAAKLSEEQRADPAAGRCSEARGRGAELRRPRGEAKGGEGVRGHFYA